MIALKARPMLNANAFTKWFSSVGKEKKKIISGKVREISFHIFNGFCKIFGVNIMQQIKYK